MFLTKNKHIAHKTEFIFNLNDECHFKTLRETLKQHHKKNKISKISTSQQVESKNKSRNLTESTASAQQKCLLGLEPRPTAMCFKQSMMASPNEQELKRPSTSQRSSNWHVTAVVLNLLQFKAGTSVTCVPWFLLAVVTWLVINHVAWKFLFRG